MTDYAVNLIIALLPLTAIVLVTQVNPYHALIIRGILGAVSALIYAVLGAADVALTEALVGTLLSVMLFAVAVRSSLVMRLGVLQGRLKHEDNEQRYEDLIADLRAVLSRYHLRLELVPYLDTQALHQGLIDREIHGGCFEPASSACGYLTQTEDRPYQLLLRVRRLHEILQRELRSPGADLAYVSTPEAHPIAPAPVVPKEAHP